MEITDQMNLQERFMAATESFVQKVKDDPNVIAVIVCGSLSYDMVWEKSDVDMTLVIRDQPLKNESYCILEDDIVINVRLVPRNGFKRFLEGLTGGSMLQSYFARGKIVFTRDESLYEFLDDIRHMGKDDMALSVFFKACDLVYLYHKSMKWLTVKNDLLYAQYYLLHAADVIANIEVCKSGESPNREAILKALTLNKSLLEPYYQGAMSHHYSEAEIRKGLDGIDRYLEDNLDLIKKPVIDFMSDQQIKTLTLICKHFRTEGHFIEGIFDYLYEKGVIEKVAQTIRITPKSKLAVEELGYIYLP